jgi:superfamily II DNA helicase RecQ
MTDDFTLTIKEILDKAGLDISVEQIEAGLEGTTESGLEGTTESGLKGTNEKIPCENPWQDDIIKKIEEESKDSGVPSGESRSYKGKRQFIAMAGEAELEYSGRASKKYQGDAILLIKPDDSLIVHGLRGVKPMSYITRADDIRFIGKDRKLTVTAVAGSDKLVITFLRIQAFQNLFGKTMLEKVQRPALQPHVGPPDLTDEEKALEARLRKLRIQLAQREGITFLPAIYDNRTMQQLVRQKPKTIEDLRQIKGFGTKRLDRYAASVLETINGSAGDMANA